MRTHKIVVGLSDADYRTLVREAEQRGVDIPAAVEGVIRDGLTHRRRRAAFGEALSAYSRALGLTVPTRLSVSQTKGSE